MSAGWPRRALDWLRDAVALGDAEGLVLLPVGALAVLAAVVDNAAAGAARHGRLLLPAVAADNGVVAGGGLLLHRHGFGRASALLRSFGVLGNPATPIGTFFRPFPSLGLSRPAAWVKGPGGETADFDWNFWFFIEFCSGMDCNLACTRPSSLVYVWGNGKNAGQLELGDLNKGWPHAELRQADP